MNKTEIFIYSSLSKSSGGEGAYSVVVTDNGKLSAHETVGFTNTRPSRICLMALLAGIKGLDEEDVVVYTPKNNVTDRLISELTLKAGGQFYKKRNQDLWKKLYRLISKFKGSITFDNSLACEKFNNTGYILAKSSAEDWSSILKLENDLERLQLQ